MNWIYFAVLAYLIFALSQLIDKALLNIAFKEVKAYVCLIGFLGSLVVVLIPFGITILSPALMLWAFVGGALFILALIPFLSALQGDDASRIIPLIGGLIPIGSLVGEYLFLGSTFQNKTLLAFALLVAGAVILTFSRSEGGRRSYSAVAKAVLGSILFAGSFVITKHIFNESSFLDGFFWMRIGGVVVAMFLLLSHPVRNELKQFFTKYRAKVQFTYFGNVALNGGGFVLQSYAISLGSVALVNALQGIQYIFVILFIVIASKFKPDLLGEKISTKIIVEKLTAILIIFAGIALLAF